MRLPTITNNRLLVFLVGFPLGLLALCYIFYCIAIKYEIQLIGIYILIVFIPLAIICYFSGIAYCTRYILNTDIERILNSGIDPLEEKPCRYCTRKPAGPYLCSHCKSILWYNIKGNRALEISIFLLENRWEFISSIGALFVVLPLSLLFTKMSELQKENETKLNDNMTSVNILLDNLSVTRSKINYLETLGPWSYDMKIWNQGFLIKIAGGGRSPTFVVTTKQNHDYDSLPV